MSLTPSLVPREALAQGALAGLCFIVGYGIGIAACSVWTYLQLPARRPGRWLSTSLLAACVAASVYFLVRSVGWQNAVRALMGLSAVDASYPLVVVAVAIPVAVLLLMLARMVLLLARFVFRLMGRFVPHRAAVVLATALSAVIVWMVGNDLLVRSVFRALDASYSQYDALLEPERARPRESRKTGGPGSLVEWDELGRAGREFVASAPAASDISTLTGGPAREPIRVYVGLRGGETPQARATLALDELIRQGGFERRNLVVMTPTGTGWIDPAAADTLDFVTGGDVASVAVQYSYLSSPLSLLAQAEYGADSAQALFKVIYDHWTAMPAAKRPRFYLHGLSLGALNSQISANLFEIIDDPIQGVLWSGPPFASSLWERITAARDAGSPARLPVFRDGRLVRFMDQNGASTPPDANWGALRVVYLQYASDPIVFFSPADFYRRPQWLKEPLGEDVSPEFRWFPVVTGFQLVLDMLVANQTPVGHGHVYAPAHYAAAWLAILGVTAWTPDQTRALERRFPEPDHS